MITLEELIAHSRSRADMEKSQFIDNTELISYINHSISELHDILIQSYGADYSVKTVEFNLVNNQDTYAINDLIDDDDFYKLMGLDAKINNSDWTTLSPFNFNERNRFQHFNVSTYLGITNFRYRLSGSNIIFAPIPDSAMPCRMWYIPVAQKLTELTDTLDDLNDYDEYIICDVAIKMMQKAELDVSVLMAQKAALKRRIEEASQNRDAGKSDSVSDIYAEDYRWWY